MTDTNTSHDQTSEQDFDKHLANQVANEFLKEQRRNRRWGIFFKCLFAVYLLGFFAIYLLVL